MSYFRKSNLILGKQPWIYGKKRASDRFFKSLPQNQPGFGKGSNLRKNQSFGCFLSLF
jgi:hypothetical protein